MRPQVLLRTPPPAANDLIRTYATEYGNTHGEQGNSPVLHAFFQITAQPEPASIQQPADIKHTVT